MAHELFGERFYARGKPGWHNLGTVFPQDAQLTLTDAFKQVIDYDVNTYPVVAKVTLPDETVMEVELPNRVAIVRSPTNDDPTWLGLDVVSDTYKLVDDFALAKAFDPISEVWPVETVGILHKGKRLFAALDAGMFNVGGIDPIHQYFVLTEDKSGREATKAIYTPVRVVCQNTLSHGLSVATFTGRFDHKGVNQERIESFADAILEMQQGIQQTNALFNNMAKTPFNLDDFKRLVINKIYPEPTPIKETVTSGNEIDFTRAVPINVTEEFERAKQRQQEYQEASIELFQTFNDEQPFMANTQWAAWNAITELEDWRPGRGLGQHNSALFGDRAKTKQLALAEITND